MNTFYEHHKHSIKFAYRCFDRILLNGLIQPFSAARTTNRLLQCLSGGQTDYSQLPARYRRAISKLGQEPVPEMGRADPGCARGQA
jgi:hypothetical protein